MNTIKNTGDTAKSWEVEFDKKFPWIEVEHDDGCYSAYNMAEKGSIKDFIRTLLKEQREEIYNEVTLIDELYQDPDTMRVWNGLKNKVLQIINSKK